MPPKVKQEVHLKTSKAENVRMSAPNFALRKSSAQQRTLLYKSSDIRDVRMDQGRGNKRECVSRGTNIYNTFPEIL